MLDVRLIFYKIQINLSVQHVGWGMDKIKVSELSLGFLKILFYFLCNA